MRELQKKLERLNKMVEAFVNAGFETGDFTGWTQFQASIDTTHPHTGTYAAFLYECWLRQSFTPIPVSKIIAFTFWARNYNSGMTHYHDVYIHYTDETQDTVQFVVSPWGGDFENYWESFDLTSELDAGKSVDWIEFRGDTGQPYLLDDLSLTYVVTTVQTNAATSVLSSTATLNGNILALGSGNCDQRGFDWGISSGVYGFSWTETGDYGTGSFAHSIDTFGVDITVYFRAKAHDSGGWHYGSELTFVFSVCIITNTGGTVTCSSVLEVRMSENTKVALRKVPKRSSGEVLDYGTWKHEPLELELVLRLTDAQQTTLEAIFDASATATVTLNSDYGTWTLSGWLDDKEVRYEYSAGSNSALRPWKYRLKFYITSASFV